MARGKKKQTRKREKAAEAAAAAEEVKEDSAEFAKNEGNKSFQIGDFQKAIEWYSLAVERDPTSFKALSNRSAAYIALASKSSFEKALEDAEAVIRLQPAWPKGHFRRGIALRSLGRLREAEEALQEGLKLDADNVELLGALKSLERMGLSDRLVEEKDETDLERDTFERLNSWLLDGGASFPLLYMKRYSENNRGVHARVDVKPDTTIMRIPRKFLITVEMGKETTVGQKMVAANLDLSAPKHCYLSVFVLLDRRNPDSFFQPYYKILPSSYPNMPVFWTEEELGHMAGSYFLTQVKDRKANIKADYDDICSVAPEFRSVSLEEFTWARMMVASRNFGITIAQEKDKRGKRTDVKTDALVPLADMLNHYRPRETSWEFNLGSDAFEITSIRPLAQGHQIYDSYGKKCNSRFLLNYGFAVESNRDPDGLVHNEVRLRFRLDPSDPFIEMKRGLLGGKDGVRGIRISMHHDGPDATKEAFSYARFICARGSEEVLQLPQLTGEVDLGKTPIQPISCENEIRVLRLLARMAREQLERYPTTLEEDEEILRSGTYAFGSNPRNCVVVRKGEKEVCHFYISLAAIAIPLLCMEWKDCKKRVNSNFSRPNPPTKPRDDYITKVVSGLVRKRGSKPPPKLAELLGEEKH